MVLNRLSLSAENIGSGTDPKKEDEEVPKGFSTLRTRRYSEKEERSSSDTQSRCRHQDQDNETRKHSQSTFGLRGTEIAMERLF